MCYNLKKVVNKNNNYYFAKKLAESLQEIK